jgi:hypothetical protein
MLELACDELVFHFNKGHLADPTIPMWVVKAKGKTYYINHMDCTAPWSTKETPDNPTTKGSLKVKKCLLTIDDENCATVTILTEDDIKRLERKEKGLIRLITKRWDLLKDYLSQLQIEYAPMKMFTGTCTATFYVTEIVDQGNLTMLMLAMGGQVRELMPNEYYFQVYDDPRYKNQEEIDTDDYRDEDEDD